MEQFDVNFNGEITSLDALQVINYLGRFPDIPVELANNPFERYYDVDGSGTASALDALLVINTLGQVVERENEFLAPAARQVKESIGEELVEPVAIPRAEKAVTNEGWSEARVLPILASTQLQNSTTPDVEAADENDEALLRLLEDL